MASDINECELPAIKCHLNADCFNSAGSYQCRCRFGYRGNGSYCVSKFLDTWLTVLCKTETGICNSSLIFQFRFLLFVCFFFLYFLPADGSCGGVVCGENSKCVARATGSRERHCVCKNGWTGDGRSCTGKKINQGCPLKSFNISMSSA